MNGKNYMLVLFQATYFTVIPQKDQLLQSSIDGHLKETSSWVLLKAIGRKHVWPFTTRKRDGTNYGFSLLFDE